MSVMDKNIKQEKPGGLCSLASSYGAKNIKEIDYDGSIDRLNRIMDFYSMSRLLQPKHPYFADKLACIDNFQGFKEPEHNKMLLFTRLSGVDGARLPRANTYRKHQLARTNTARRIKMVKKLVESYHLKEFRFAFMTLTMPKELSTWLSYQKNGKDIAWRMFNKFWAWYDGYFGTGMAASVNLHTWRSEIPLEPHFHFHSLIPNYKMKENGIEDEGGEKCYEFEHQEWHRQRNGGYVPVSEKDLKEMKKVWWHIIAKLCNRHKVDWYGLASSEFSQKLDIHYAYGNWWDWGKVKLMHWFNYQGRYPLEDYAIYSNKHLDCPKPEKWLENYENHSRIFGWWKIMGKMVDKEPKERIKINPVTGNNMEYYGTWTIYELMNAGKVGFLEVIRGSPVYHQLSGKELTWLLSVQKHLHPALERDNIYDTQVEESED